MRNVLLVMTIAITLVGCSARDHITPLELPTGRTFMTWHERVNDDAAHAWLRDLTARCTAAVMAGPPKRPRPTISGA